MPVLQDTTKVASKEIDHVTTAQGSGGDGEGLDWLTMAATAAPPVVSSAPGAMESAVDDAEVDGGLDWLAVAKSSGQKKSKPQVTAAVAKGTAAPAAPGGWMSSGKLGISTEDEDDDIVGTTNGGDSSAGAGAGKAKKRKQVRGSVSAASGPGGWLLSGSLGAEPEEESEDDDGGGDAKVSARGVGITIETQTEDDIEAVTGKGAVEKAAASKLPPWAKPYVPLPQTTEVPDTLPKAEETKETEKQVLGA